MSLFIKVKVCYENLKTQSDVEKKAFLYKFYRFFFTVLIFESKLFKKLSIFILQLQNRHLLVYDLGQKFNKLFLIALNFKMNKVTFYILLLQIYKYFPFLNSLRFMSNNSKFNEKALKLKFFIDISNYYSILTPITRIIHFCIVYNFDHQSLKYFRRTHTTARCRMCF